MGGEGVHQRGEVLFALGILQCDRDPAFLRFRKNFCKITRTFGRWRVVTEADKGVHDHNRHPNGGADVQAFDQFRHRVVRFRSGFPETVGFSERRVDRLKVQPQFVRLFAKRHEVCSARPTDEEALKADLFPFLHTPERNGVVVDAETELGFPHSRVLLSIL